MGILDLIFGIKNKLPFSKTLEFIRVESDLDVKVGDEPKIWNRPESSTIYLYPKGSAGGIGLAGIAFNSTISYHLRNTKYLFIETKIVGLTKNRIDLYVKLFTNKEAVIEKQEKDRIKWIESVQKKYNPKTNWELRFFSESQIKKNNLKINTVSKDIVANYYEKMNEAIWLTDNQGVKIEAENRIRGDGTEKTLKAVFSGHELEIKQLVKDYYWYYLEVGTKDKGN